MTHIHAKAHVAAPKPHLAAHKAEEQATVTVHVAKDNSRVTGSLPRLSRAQTQPLQALPWEAHGPALDPWMGELRGNFMTTWHATTQHHTTSVLTQLKGKLTDAGLAAVKTLKEQDKLNQGWLGHTLLNRLQNFVKHGGHKELESAALEQIASPDKIQQARPDSCAAADMQRNLATEHPTKYLAVVNSLFKFGEAKLHGHTLKISSENMAEIKAMHLKGPALVNAMFQAAAMDVANGKAGYDFKSDTSIFKKHGHLEREQGLTGDAMKTLDAIVGDAPVVTPKDLHHKIEALQKQGLSEFDAKKQVLESELASALKAGHQGAMFAVKDNRHHLAHAVIVTKVANGEVTFVDGHQRQHQVPEAAFMHHLCQNEHDRIGSGITFGSTSFSGTSYYAPPPAWAPWH